MNVIQVSIKSSAIQGGMIHNWEPNVQTIKFNPRYMAYCQTLHMVTLNPNSVGTIIFYMSKTIVSRKSDTGSKGYPFLDLARGAKEAADLFTRREFVGGQHAERKQTYSDLPRFRPPEG